MSRDIFKIKDFLIKQKSTLKEAMECLAQTTKGIALVVDKQKHLINTITDGDVRRAILDDISLDQSVEIFLERRKLTNYPQTITASENTSNLELIHLMKEKKIQQIPLLDKTGRVVNIALLADLIDEPNIPVTTVIMAGGYGKRMKSLTEKTPKPMLPIGEIPILEFIVN